MRRLFRITTAAYPAMALAAIVAFFFSERAPAGLDHVRDTIFPFIHYTHVVGGGIFTPGSFVFNFFASSALLMGAMNAVLPAGLLAPLFAGRANVFYYILFLILAIFEVAADTLLPILALPGPHAFGLAVTIVHGGFIAALVLAILVSKGANREW